MGGVIGAKTAVLNGFGRTLGDGIMGLQALSVASARGMRATLFRLPGLSPVLTELYTSAAFAEIRDLPWEFATREREFHPAERFDRVIDIRDFAFDPAFQRTSMIDYFLAALGLDPASVPQSEKRNAWLAPSIRPAPPLPPGYLLLCPNAAQPMRAMPDHVHDALCARLPGDVVSQKGRPSEANLAALCGLVVAARAVIATDTAMVHLADAFGVPCLAFFPTHDPAWRVRDYPLCTAVALPGPLPSGLEFARDNRDVAAAHAAWRAGIVLPAVDDFLGRYSG